MITNGTSLLKAGIIVGAIMKLLGWIKNLFN